MSQLTFAEAEYQNKKRKTRREIFLEKMDAIIPWKRLENRAAKHYPKGEPKMLFLYDSIKTYFIQIAIIL